MVREIALPPSMTGIYLCRLVSRGGATWPNSRPLPIATENMSRGTHSELTLPPLLPRPKANVWSPSHPASRKSDQYKQARERDKRQLHDAHSTMRRALKTTIPVERTAKKFNEVSYDNYIQWRCCCRLCTHWNNRSILKEN